MRRTRTEGAPEERRAGALGAPPETCGGGRLVDARSWTDEEAPGTALQPRVR